jgi:hypothetical protein
VQWKWARAGAQTGRSDILSSAEYTTATPFNFAFVISMGRVKNYWHHVKYSKLLAI